MPLSSRQPGHTENAMTMTNERLDAMIREHADAIHHSDLGRWQFDYYGHSVIVLTDEVHNRMRVMTPVGEAAAMDEELAMECLRANFDRALDARYAISGDYVWSAFIHPLSELNVSQVVDAFNQVVSLAATYGTSFTSGSLAFGRAEQDTSDEDDQTDG